MFHLTHNLSVDNLFILNEKSNDLSLHIYYYLGMNFHLVSRVIVEWKFKYSLNDKYQSY